MNDDQSAPEEKKKAEWVKPVIEIMDADAAEAAPGVGVDSYYNYS